MDEKIISLLTDRPVIIPRIIFNNYKRLNINEDELIILIFIMDLGNKIKYNPDIFVNELNMDKLKVMEIISNLNDKNILSIEMIKNGRKNEEYISLDILYDKLLNIVIDNKEDNEVINDSIFNVFEDEMGRLLSVMEIEIIKEWISTYKNEELIILALKEAVINGANSLRYIDSILNDWNKKGYKTKEDILRDKENYRKKKNVKVYDTDWLND